MAFDIPAGQEKFDYVQSKFTGIAGKYDLFNDLVTQGMHRYWKRFLVHKAGLKKGDRVMDICCGTGDITERLSKAVGSKGQTIGLDFSAGMLRVARSRNLENDILFLQGDAMKLPVSTNTMDSITVGYGLRNLTDITACLQDVLRALKPGGRFLSLDMGKVDVPVIKQFFHLYFFYLVPFIGKLMYPGEDMFDYFPESAVNYPSQEKLKNMLNTVGFSNVSYFNFNFGSIVVHYAEKPKE